MMQKNIILDSLKDSFAAVWHNRGLFILLFLLQIIFFAILFSVSQKYLPRMLENAKAISDYISQQQFDEVAMTERILQQKNILGDDPLSISRNFEAMKMSFRIYLSWVFISLIIFTALNWAITNKIMYKNLLFKKNIIKNSLIVFIGYGLIFLFLLLLFNVQLSEAASLEQRASTLVLPFMIFALALLYFMVISLSISYSTELKNILQKALSIGIRKAHYFIAAYMIIILLLITSVSLLIYFVERNFFIVVVSILLLVFSFVFGRIFILYLALKLYIIDFMKPKSDKVIRILEEAEKWKKQS